MSVEQLKALLLLWGLRKLVRLQQKLIPGEAGDAVAVWGCQAPQRTQGRPLHSQEPSLRLRGVLMRACVAGKTSALDVMSSGLPINALQASSFRPCLDLSVNNPKL